MIVAKKSMPGTVTSIYNNEISIILTVIKISIIINQQIQFIDPDITTTTYIKK